MPIGVMFVCLGNICRSPMAEAVFAQMAADQGLEGHFEIASAGTIGLHAGAAPHPDTQSVLQAAGYRLTGSKAQAVVLGDFERFHYLLAMDAPVEASLRQMAPPGAADQIHRFLSLAPDVLNEDVPDPYQRGREDFEHVLGLVEQGCRGLMASLIARHPELRSQA